MTSAEAVLGESPEESDQNDNLLGRKEARRVFNRISFLTLEMGRVNIHLDKKELGTMMKLCRKSACVKGGPTQVILGRDVSRTRCALEELGVQPASCLMLIRVHHVLRQLLALSLVLPFSIFDKFSDTCFLLDTMLNVEGRQKKSNVSKGLCPIAAYSSVLLLSYFFMQYVIPKGHLGPNNLGKKIRVK